MYDHTRNNHNGSTQRSVPDDYPVTLATAYLRHIGHFNGSPLRHWREDFYLFERCVYRKLVPEELTADVTLFLNSLQVGKAKDRKPLRVTNNVVSETLKQMRAICQVRKDRMPTWLTDEEGQPDPKNVIAFENGLLDVDTFLSVKDAPLLDPTPDWFSEAVLPCYYDPKATCPTWLKFLDEALGDQELIEVLQEWFGYCLTGDNSFHKMLWLHGRSGAGKSTTINMLKRVVGERNSVSFSLWDLVGRFTLSAFVGKTLATSQDAHLGKDTDSLRVIEQLKAISGGDDRMIDRKNRELLPSIRLQTRFVISVNQFPALPDAGDTLRRRSIIIPFENTFAGREDRHMDEKLAAEIAGVVTWSLAGLRRLQERGKFLVTKKGLELQYRFTRLNSPVQAFVDECCVVHETWNADCPPRVNKDDLYKCFTQWSKRNGHGKPMVKERFCEAFLATVPTAKPTRPQMAGMRVHAYDGVELTPAEQERLFRQEGVLV